MLNRLSLGGEFWPAAIVGAARQSSTNRGLYIKSGKDVWNGENKFRRNCNTAPLADLNAKSARFFSALSSAATQEVFAPGFPSDSQAGGRATPTAFLRARTPQIPVSSRAEFAFYGNLTLYYIATELGVHRWSDRHGRMKFRTSCAVRTSTQLGSIQAREKCWLRMALAMPRPRTKPKSKERR